MLHAPRVVAVVGARAASRQGLDIAAAIGGELAAAGIVVVSGLARGVDTAAHRAALDAGGRSIAVLGSGLDKVYPAEHERLAGALAERGAVVSECGPGAPPLPHHFPLRNRIISGLAAATVVVEASEKSGSLITAAAALDQGREVMAVPGPVAPGRHRGAHALLRDGATLVERADDVMAALGWATPAVGGRGPLRSIPRWPRNSASIRRLTSSTPMTCAPPPAGRAAQRLRHGSARSRSPARSSALAAAVSWDLGPAC